MSGFEPIGIGLTANDGLGDAPRVVGAKLNRMLAELFAELAAQRDRIAELEAGGVLPATSSADFSRPANSGIAAAIVV